MDILTMIIGFVGGGSVLASLLIAWIKQKIKQGQENRLTDITILAILFAICLIISVLGFLAGYIPNQILGFAIAIFGGAITLFDTIYKAVYKKAILGEIDKPEESESEVGATK